MTNKGRDFALRGLQVLATTLVVLIVLSFVPPIEAGGVSLRRASVISDLVNHPLTSEPQPEEQPEINVEEYDVDLDKVAQMVERTTQIASPTGVATTSISL